MPKNKYLVFVDGSFRFRPYRSLATAVASLNHYFALGHAAMTAYFAFPSMTKSNGLFFVKQRKLKGTLARKGYLHDFRKTKVKGQLFYINYI
jgi:hypothetical protein